MVAAAAALMAVVHGRTTQLSLGLVLVPSQMHLMTLHWRVRRSVLAHNRNSRPPRYARCCTPKRMPSCRPLRAPRARLPAGRRQGAPRLSSPGHVSTTRVLPRVWCSDTSATPLPVAPQTRAALQAALSLLQRVGTLLSSHFCFVTELTLGHPALQHKQQHAALVVARLRHVKLDPGRGSSEMKFRGQHLVLILTLWQWQTARFRRGAWGHARCLELMMASRKISPFAAVLRHEGAQSALSVASSR